MLVQLLDTPEHISRAGSILDAYDHLSPQKRNDRLLESHPVNGLGVTDDPDLDRTRNIAQKRHVMEGPPTETRGDVIAKKASPAPTVSTTLLANAGTQLAGSPRDVPTLPSCPG